jgi:hypothetical protein
MRTQAMTKSKSMLLSASLLGLSVPAQAANIFIACQVVPCVYDSHNQIVGLGTIPSGALRQIKGQWWILDYDSGGLNPGVEFLYSDSHCTSTPYINTGTASDAGKLVLELPQRASYDGQAIWGSNGSEVEITVMGFRFPTITSQCISQAAEPFGEIVRPAAIIDPTPFYPPFNIH